MKGIVAWFVRNGVAANMVMWTIFGGGLFVLVFGKIAQEVFPRFPLDLITISVEYLGAAPEEVEEGVCVRIEEEIASLEGIKRLTSVAAEGIGTVTVELQRGTDVRKLLDDIKTRVDAINTFPEETEKPIIQEITNRRQVINIAVSGDADERTLKRLAEQVRDDLSAVPGISQVELSSARPYEISIEVSEETLRRHDLQFDDVVAAVRRSSLDLPGGSVKTAGGEILLRTKGQAYRGPEFERLVLLTRPDGTRLLLGDVATVVDGFADTDQAARFNGEPAVIVQVFRVGEERVLDVADTVKKYVSEAQHRMPEGIALTPFLDATEVLRSRMSLLTRNALNGGILVFIVLALFLRLRLAFWVTLGMIISFLGALWFMPALGVSINVISLFAFILVLGIVVDDAIIVGENIFSWQKRTGEGVRGAIEGVGEVMTPVVYAVLTTVVFFIPLLNVEGTIGKVMSIIPLIVIPCLLFSLIESLLVLPRHLSHLRPGSGGSLAHSAQPRRGSLARLVAGPRTFLDGFSRGVEWSARNLYGRLLEVGLRWRYLTAAIAVSTLILMLALFRFGWIRFTFFPPVESDYMSAALTLPQGTSAVTSAEAVRRLENSALDLQNRLRDESDNGADSAYRSMFTAIGGQPYRRAQNRNAGTAGGDFSGAYKGEVLVELTPAESRAMTSTELVNRWRELTGPIPDVTELTFTSSLFSSGDAINVQLTGPDIDGLRAAAAKLKKKLAEYPGVFSIADSFRAGKREVKLDIKPQAEAYGLSLQDLAKQVRQGFYGVEAQRIQRGRDDLKVMVRYPASRRRSLGDLEGMRVRTPGGLEVPFSVVGEALLGRGYASIKRVDRQRVINVTADVNRSQANENQIMAELAASFLPSLLAEHPRIRYTFEGQQREQRDTIGGLRLGFVFAVFIIIIMLAVAFRSYLQPFIVVSAVPFGIVGAMWGHMLMGMDLTILSMFGIVALSGVVVNDNLVLVDFINRKRAGGAPTDQAVREAGVARFRPILLTSLTTFAGLTPLLLEKSMQAQFIIPMATSLAFGVLFATAISLMLVPSGYLILEDIKEAARWILRLYGFRLQSRHQAQV
jgi:multidrug efflux pump subunit AcrB